MPILDCIGFFYYKLAAMFNFFVIFLTIVRRTIYLIDKKKMIF